MSEAMPDEEGFTEAYRIRFPSNIGDRLRKVADLEGRSPQNMIRYFTIKGLAEWHFQRELPVYISKVLNGENGGK